MKTLRYLHYFLMAFLLFASSPAGAAKKKKSLIPDKPEWSRQVYDFAHILTEDQLFKLENKLSHYRAESGNQIVVVTEDKMAGGQPAVLESYCTELFNTWGIGEAGKDNGLLLYLAVKDRKLRFEVGRGMEKYFPDSLASDIVQKRMIPLLKKGELYEGLDWGASVIIQKLKQEEEEKKPASAKSGTAAPAFDSKQGSEPSKFEIIIHGLGLLLGGGVFIALLIFLVRICGFGGWGNFNYNSNRNSNSASNSTTVNNYIKGKKGGGGRKHSRSSSGGGGFFSGSGSGSSGSSRSMNGSGGSGSSGGFGNSGGGSSSGSGASGSW